MSKSPVQVLPRALLVLALLLGCAIPGGAVSSSPQPVLTVSEYSAEFEPDGTLAETFLYSVETGDFYTMLYRSFDAPLSSGTADQPYIEFISISPPPDTIPFVKDYRGLVTLPGHPFDASTSGTVQRLALPNEAGIYSPAPFETGPYPVTYSFRLHPPVGYAGDFALVNIMLAGKNHVSYEKVTITLPSQDVKSIHWYPPHLSMTRENDRILISGNLEKDEEMGFELSYLPGTILPVQGFSYTNDPLGAEASDETLRSEEGFTYFLLLLVLVAGFLASSLGSFILKRRRGTTERTTRAAGYLAIAFGVATASLILIMVYTTWFGPVGALGETPLQGGGYFEGNLSRMQIVKIDYLFTGKGPLTSLICQVSGGSVNYCSDTMMSPHPGWGVYSSDTQRHIDLVRNLEMRMRMDNEIQMAIRGSLRQSGFGYS